MAELAAVYVSIIPETSRIAPGVRRAFRGIGPEAQRAGRASGDSYSQGFARSALAGLANTWARVARESGANARTMTRDINRITSALLVMKAAAKTIGALNRFGKIAAVGTMGFSALLGAVAGVVQLVGGPLLSAITAVGAAMGVAAGAAAGILGPALVALKVGFKGLSDGAKEFNKQFADVDEALNKRLGNMMAPLLTAWHDASNEMKLAFATALQPAFASVGGLVGQLRPQLAGLSTTLGGVGTEIAKSLTGPVAKQGFADMIAASNTFFSAFLGESGLGGLASGLVSFAGTASKTFAGVGTSINEAFLDAGEWLRNISPEQMAAAMDQVKQVFQNVAAVVGPVISGLRQLAGISAPALAPGFQAIGQAVTDATPGIMQMARELMPALGQVMSNLAPLLPSLVQAFTPWASVVAVLAPHIATLVANLGSLAPVILGIALAVKGISSAMVLWNAGMAVASVAQGVFAAATGAGTASLAGNTIALTAHRVALVAGAVATNAAAAATRIFNAVLAMNPIGLIITAITALVAGLVWFFTQTETGRKVWETCWNAIKIAAAAVVSWFTDTALPFLTRVWEGIKTGWNTLVASAQAVWDGVQQKFTGMVDFVKSIPTKIASAASGMWDGISNAFKSTINAMIGVWNSFASKLSFTMPDFPGVPRRGEKIQLVPTIGQFADGGWTGPGGKYKPAGIVHADEFVLSKAARGSVEGKFPGLLDFMNRTGTLPGYAGGGLVAGASQLKNIISEKFGISDIGGYRPADGYNEHSTGRALDVMIGNNMAKGDAVKDFAIANASAIDLKWAIWKQRLWYPDGSSQAMEDRGSPTQNHMDHVHIFSGPGITDGLKGALSGGTAGSTPSVSEPTVSGPKEPTSFPSTSSGSTPSSSSSSSSSSSPSKSTSGSGSGSKSKQEQAAGDLGKIFAGGILETFGFDGSVFANPFEWDGIKFLTSFFNKGGSGGFGTLANVFNPTQQTSTVTGQNALTANGDGGGALASAATNIATTALDANRTPTTVDNRIVIENAGMDPQALQTSVEKKRTERTRTYATAGAPA